MTTTGGTTNIYDLEKENRVIVDQENIHELVSGLQKVSKTGITQLHSRDISMTTDKNVQDLESLPSYIPPDRQQSQQYHLDKENDYENDPTDNQINKMKTFYDELQMPLFIAVLYFVFQLPAYKKYVLYFIPLLSADGNFNLYGYIFNSLFFALFYCVLSKIKI